MTPGGRVGELEVAPELQVGSPRDHHGPCLLDSGWFQKGIYLEYTRVACNCVLQKKNTEVAIIVFDMENYCLWRNNPIEPYRMRRDRCLPRALRKLVCLGSRWCRRGRRWCRGRTLWRDARIISGQGGVRIRATPSSWAAARVFLRQSQGGLLCTSILASEIIYFILQLLIRLLFERNITILSSRSRSSSSRISSSSSSSNSSSSSSSSSITSTNNSAVSQ